jgi:dihydroflavonol-4-reductase
MKVLVTGASGLLGAAVVRALNHAGVQIHILTRRNSDIAAISDFVHKQIFGDINDYGAVADCIRNCDAVVHAAALTKQTGISTEEYNRVNVGGTVNILKAGMQNGNPRLVYVSSASTIKFGRPKMPANELANAEEDFGSGYIKSKIIAEHQVQRATQIDSINAVIVNPTFMIGPMSNKSSSGELVNFALMHKILPCPPGGKNFVDVNDVATCIVRSLTHGKTGERYLIANENLSYVEFFKLVGQAQGVRKVVFEIPKFAWTAAQNVLNVYERTTHPSTKINATMMKISAAETYYTGEKAKREFGVRYTPISDSLKRIVNITHPDDR